ncbi:peptidase S49 [Methylobacterium indicum]|uniref:S49 family peptidase n=1 Tax=Methylobacterium indicum TaxID=1775910 RepID=UPI0007345942|nr:S49 family peptidase [Methylobacterium indicum]KTS30857.1 peptidase S49 [Methylobacterium indicum]KTS41555.1 peptidase S49 [Methylobacterium indicum]KTS45170.1 peptidase S49 [Methylobacterium indicum]
MQYHRIAGQFFNRPLLLTPPAADTISNFILSRVGGPEMRAGDADEHTAQKSTTFFPAQAGGDGTLTVHTPQASRFYGETPLSEDGSRRPLPFRRTAEGVAIITLVGEWVNRGGWIGASSGLISYEGFKVQMLAAAADPRTKSILLDLESPGGEAVGAFEAAAVVRRVAAEKPVTALVNGMAASAAYAIASAANRIVSIPTGISGSIGVVMMHLDLSEYLKKEGIKPTFIHAGARKVDANPYQALPADVRDRLQGEIDDFYALFVQTVAAGRPGLTEKAIRATEADTFMGADALDAGLVDALASFEEVLAELSTDKSPAGRNPPGASMSAHTTATALAALATAGAAATPTSIPTATALPAAGPVAGVPQADFDAAVARARAEGHATGLAEGTAAGASAERTRIKSILGSDEAKGREAMASHLAFATDQAPEAAVGLLATAPKAAAPSPASLDSRMAGRIELNLDADAPPAGQTGAKQEGAADWADIAAAANARLPAGARVPGR